MKRTVKCILLMVTIVLFFIPTVIFAGDECEHKFVDGKCTLCRADDHDHMHSGWTKITTIEALRTLFANGGNGYLASDIALAAEDDDLIVASEKIVSLCLNGHVIQRVGYKKDSESTLSNSGGVIQISGTLKLFDCDTTTPHFFIEDTIYKFPEDDAEIKYSSKYTFNDSDVYKCWRLTDTKTANVVYGGCITGGRPCNAQEKALTQGGGINVSKYATLEMYGGNIVGNSNTRFYSNSQYGYTANGGGVFLDAATLRMYGGTICHNYSANFGGGIAARLTSRVEMYGGKIEYNTARAVGDGSYGNGGGGIADWNNSTMSMYGGTISNNYTYGRGGGLLHNSTAAPIVGGTAVIKDNVQVARSTMTETLNNLYLGENKTITLASSPNTPTNGMNVGVNTVVEPTSEISVNIAGNAVAEYAKFFYSDSPQYYVAFDSGDGYLKLSVPEANKYAINVITPEHGEAISDVSQQESGQTVTLTVNPNSGYQFGTDSLRANYNDGADTCELTKVNDSTYTFTMPSYPVTVAVVFEPKKSTVTLNMRGGTGGTESVTATYDSEMPSATMPTKAGYTFAGYFDAEDSGTQYYDENGNSVKKWDRIGATETLYAVWELKSSSGGSADLVPYESVEPSVIKYTDGYLHFDANTPHVITYAKAMTGNNFTEFGAENKGIYIDLTDETLTSSFAFNYYSLDQGKKWYEATEITQDMLKKWFSKDINVRLTDKLDDRHKKPVEDSVVYGFETIKKRPSAPSLKLDFKTARDDYAVTNGQWMLVSKNYKPLEDLYKYEIRITDDTGTEFAMNMTGVPEGTKGSLFENYGAFTTVFGESTWGRWPSEGGVWVPDVGTDGKTRKAKIEIRTAAAYDGSNYTAAGKVKKLSVTSITKAPAVKVNYQKEEIKLKKGMSVYFGTADSIRTDESGVPSFYTFPDAKEEKAYEDFAGTAIINTTNLGVKKALSISPYLTENRNTILLWQTATQKKPASARQILKLEARYTLTKETLPEVSVSRGKAKVPEKFEILSKGKWTRSMPAVTTSTVINIRCKADAKGGKESAADAESTTFAASDTAYLVLFYGEYTSGTKAKPGVEAASIFLTKEEAEAAIAEWDAAKAAAAAGTDVDSDLIDITAPATPEGDGLDILPQTGVAGMRAYMCFGSLLMGAGYVLVKKA